MEEEGNDNIETNPVASSSTLGSAEKSNGITDIDDNNNNKNNGE